MLGQTIKWVALGAGIAALAGCGDTLGEQAIIGGGAGAAGAVVTDGDPIVGAAVGAAANVAYCQRYPSRC
ncbi:hypothetical protein [Primorskyibacter sedentarius]|uniref:YmgG-like glycine-zipper protein n=1 Tax=Primorskyibacter sedentarius TaxID=745311 RepID=A0A4R3JLA2_9RHOB|nr:hypothetical protein [Primorskyibacter sedentarius]TCS65710.1 hypothetical protein EDD52_103126 [Primorskyibacter sedentarius]